MLEQNKDFSTLLYPHTSVQSLNQAVTPIQNTTLPSIISFQVAVRVPVA